MKTTVLATMIKDDGEMTTGIRLRKWQKAGYSIKISRVLNDERPTREVIIIIKRCSVTHARDSCRSVA